MVVRYCICSVLAPRTWPGSLPGFVTFISLASRTAAAGVINVSFGVGV